MADSSAGLIIFDFDNTLVHSRIDFAGIRREIIELLRTHGVTDESDEGLMRLSIGQIIALGEAHDGRAGTGLGPEAWRIVLEYERAGMREASVEACAAESLAALRGDGFRLAVLTNNARLATLEALEQFGLRSAFELVLTRDEVAMKPDPEGIERARAHFDGAIGRTAVVGDSWLDGTAAQLARAPFIAFRPRPGVMEERGVPVWSVVERLDEIPTLLAGPWPDPDSLPTVPDAELGP
jgi:phosphoglycolate phosphatase